MRNLTDWYLQLLNSSNFLQLHKKACEYCCYMFRKAGTTIPLRREGLLLALQLQTRAELTTAAVRISAWLRRDTTSRPVPVRTTSTCPTTPRRALPTVQRRRSSAVDRPMTAVSRRRGSVMARMIVETAPMNNRTAVSFQLLHLCLYLSVAYAPCGAGAPLFPLFIYFLIFSLFTFSFLSLALPIFFFCPSLPFLPE